MMRLLCLLPLCLAPVQDEGDAPLGGGFDPVAQRVYGAQSALAQGELGTAYDLLRGALQEAPQATEVRYWLGRVLNDMGRHAEALEALEPALARLPRSPRILTESGRALAGTGEAENAEQCLRDALEVYPRCGPARLELSELLLASQRLADAQSTLTPLFEQAPNEPAVVVLMARVLEAQGRAQEGIALIEKRLEEDPHDAPMRLALGRLLIDVNAPQQAWATVEPVLRDARDVPTLFFIARVARKAGRPLDALAALGAALVVDPTHSGVLGELGAVLDQRAQLAERIARRRVEAHPEDADGWLQILTAHAQAGRFQEVLVDWEKVPPTLHGDPRLALQRAIALRRVGKTEDARALLNDILGAGDDKRAWYELGLLEYGVGRTERAVAAFEKGADGAWAADAHFNRGVCLDRLGRYKEAAAAYAAACDLKPDFVRAWLQRGHSFRYRLADQEQARAAYQKYLDLGGDDPEVRRYMGWKP